MVLFSRSYVLLSKIMSRQSETMIYFSSSAKSSSKLSSDLENWMRNLPWELRTLPIINLAIPGSHDSFTSNITKHSKLAPDAERAIQRLKFLGPILRMIMANWARTQTFSVVEQLQGGIRYFDLRIATKKNSPDLYFVHGLYSIDVISVFVSMMDFLKQHPHEVVILDCQHFYGFTEQDHQKLITILASMFKNKLVPSSCCIDSLTLEYLTTPYQYQVIVIYRSSAAQFGQHFLFPSASFPNPWANTDKISKLIDALNTGIDNRDFSSGFISQCVLTPSSSFVVRNLFSSLKKKCAIRFEKDRTNWLSQQSPGNGGLNIVIGDFVDLSDSRYIKQVIDLNEKLLGENK